MFIPIAKILEQRTHTVPGKLRITEHFFQVPRDYAKPTLGNLTLFARSARKHEKPAAPEDDEKKKSQLPWLVYLQGGPGFECRSPEAYAWTNTVLDRGYQVLCLDQRGTGLSSPLSASTLGLRGDDPVQAQYLKSFRADNIVRDCEAVRKALTADYPEEKRKWSLLGQSFGGFCCVTYLSFFPEGVREAFICGGLPPMADGPDDVYERLYGKVIERNEAYYAKYPEDVERVKRVLGVLRRFGEGTVRLPGEGVLSARRFLQLGIRFGFHGGIDSVHDIVLRASAELSQFGHMTRQTLSMIESTQSFDNNIIYAILHEQIYCQGTAPDWSADIILKNLKEFDLDRDGPVYFTGEMIYPFMFNHYSELRKLRAVANTLAEDSSWPALYSRPQLAKNDIPVYAAVYMDDMYVDFDFSMETAKRIRGCKTWVTNGLYHDGLRHKTDEVMKQLFALRDDSID